MPFRTVSRVKDDWHVRDLKRAVVKIMRGRVPPAPIDPGVRAGGIRDRAMKKPRLKPGLGIQNTD